MIKKRPRKESRKARHGRVRRKVSGTPECPRLAVFKSGKHIYAQLIDDVNGTTLAAASSLDKSIKGQKGTFTERARMVGELAAERAAGKGVTDVVFDRGGFKYHGRVAALAEAAREKGLNF
ncbi:MAG: 50S ribosomal protein L18 [Candidatus Eremiobacteraeota bacterium]|nr:50S ribosomal protein L18 [Candidatus Eremiobacteraeota bacterium]